ncbi:aspartyl/asparaginyl beta-hydroxylase domain-containing protein [Chitinimonas lacunae]|uniref:Aspartyl/asparaginyl beta-hydroxylase domain-containing protein n=1 Tax=Chitinimonas lacunae TaxID=1963018 RepID=A0ABV8MLY6_9NEIS
MNKKLFKLVETLNKKLSRVQGDAYLEPEQFAWVSQVEQSCEAIKAELAGLIDQEGVEVPTMAELSGGNSSVKHTNSWRALCLYLYGQRLSHQENFLPHTHAALQKIPGLKTAFLSILQPGTSIKPHRGPYNGVLRYHLGVSIPAGDCAIVVDEQQRGWANGKSLIFDDSYVHKAWNHTEETRVVLFVDFLRPLPFWYAWFNTLIYNRLCRGEFQVKFMQRAAQSTENMVKA